jgi:hypothetical protein
VISDEGANLNDTLYNKDGLWVVSSIRKLAIQSKAKMRSPFKWVRECVKDYLISEEG